jgi:molybdenum cofactor cytidylyltransferase
MPAAIGETVAVLLAAGLSRRYGREDKLMAPLRGRPLLAHAANLLAGLPFAGRIAVVSSTEGPLADLLGSRFALVPNPRPQDGQDGSVRLGLAAALAQGARHILLCLGDMPQVTATHVAAILAAGDDHVAVMSAAEAVRSPPTLMPRQRARSLLDRTDMSVRDALRGGPIATVTADPEVLRDFDGRADFQRP